MTSDSCNSCLHMWTKVSFYPRNHLIQAYALAWSPFCLISLTVSVVSHIAIAHRKLVEWLGSLFHIGCLLSDLSHLFQVVHRSLVACWTPSFYFGIATSLQLTLAYHQFHLPTMKVSVWLPLMLTQCQVIRMWHSHCPLSDCPCQLPFSFSRGLDPPCCCPLHSSYPWSVPILAVVQIGFGHEFLPKAHWALSIALALVWHHSSSSHRVVISADSEMVIVDVA